MTIDNLLPYLFWLFLFGALTATGMALTRRTPAWLFLAALFTWLMSMLAVWSVGWLILILPFIFLALAIGRWLGWVNRPRQALAAAGVAVALWLVTLSWLRELLMPIIFWPLLLLGD